MKIWVQRLFGISTNANKNQQNREQSSNEDERITDRENIEGTPFWIQRVEKQWFITLKGYAISPRMNTKEEAIKYIWLENNGWNVIANMIIIIHEQVANEAVKEWEKRQNLGMGPEKEYKPDTKEINLMKELDKEILRTEAGRGMTKDTKNNLGL